MHSRDLVRLNAYLGEHANGFGVLELADAVKKTYVLGEGEIERLLRAEITRLTGCTSHVQEIMVNSSGDLYAVHIGLDSLGGGNFVVKILDYSSTTVPSIRTAALLPDGRYNAVTVVNPPQFDSALVDFSSHVSALLMALQDWVEFQLVNAVERFSIQIADGVYRVLETLDNVDLTSRPLDVAVIGSERGWRVPRVDSVEDTITRLRRSSGKHDGAHLAATFVSVTLPRDDLLMTNALDASGAIVRPFREAAYFGSHFALACHLRHEQSGGRRETSAMRRLYKSDRVSVVAILSASDAVLAAAIDAKAGDIEQYIGANLRSFEQAVDFIEGNGGKHRLTDTDAASVGRVLNSVILDGEGNDANRGHRRFWRRNP